MLLKSRWSLFSGVAATAVVALGARSASADGTTVKNACLSAAERGQNLRTDGKLVSARDEFLVCARDDCPHLVRTDCMTWLSQIDASLPSVVFSATAGGADVTDVRVRYDGQLLLERLDGKAKPIDPGTHVFQFERAGDKVEVRVVIAEGEKNRKVIAVFDNPRTATPPPSAVSSSGGRAPVPIAAYVLGGVGLLAAGSFAYFGITGE